LFSCYRLNIDGNALADIRGHAFRAEQAEWGLYGEFRKSSLTRRRNLWRCRRAMRCCDREQVEFGFTGQWKRRGKWRPHNMDLASHDIWQSENRGSVGDVHQFHAAAPLEFEENQIGGSWRSCPVELAGQVPCQLHQLIERADR